MSPRVQVLCPGCPRSHRHGCRGEARRAEAHQSRRHRGAGALRGGLRRWRSRSKAAVAWLGFVAAFAEAATIGGLADWYAVVALFRRPLGLPIPHTAIIPANQNRIADNLGRFIEVNFLAPEPVRAEAAGGRLRRTGRRLAGRRRSAPRACRASSRRLVPQTLTAIEQSGLRDFVSQRMLDADRAR